jgi:hypothetical protein
MREEHLSLACLRKTVSRKERDKNVSGKGVRQLRQRYSCPEILVDQSVSRTTGSRDSSETVRAGDPGKEKAVQQRHAWSIRVDR